MKHTLFASVFGLLLGSGVVAAQDAPALHEGHLSHLDTDENGTLSRAEYETFMANAFSKLDQDDDGHLTQHDVSSILTADQFAATDANGDDRVSRDEFMAQVMQDFQAADRTGDGHLQ